LFHKARKLLAKRLFLHPFLLNRQPAVADSIPVVAGGQLPVQMDFRRQRFVGWWGAICALYPGAENRVHG
jgi:hypothetical protein